VLLLDRGKAVRILEVFSGAAHAFDDNDIRHLNLLAKITVEAMADVLRARRFRLRYSAVWDHSRLVIGVQGSYGQKHKR
jgi:hypothetical protein